MRIHPHPSSPCRRKKHSIRGEEEARGNSQQDLGEQLPQHLVGPPCTDQKCRTVRRGSPRPPLRARCNTTCRWWCSSGICAGGWGGVEAKAVVEEGVVVASGRRRLATASASAGEDAESSRVVVAAAESDGRKKEGSDRRRGVRWGC